MKTNRASHPLNQTTSNNKFASNVIAVAGCPGSGKTSLVNAMSPTLNATCLFYDDYQDVTSLPIEEIIHLMQQGDDYNNLHVPGFADAIAAHKQQAPQQNLLIETPLGRHHRDSGQYIDILIWIDLPLDIALARNIQAFTQEFLQSPIHESLLTEQVQWLAQYLDTYLHKIRQTLLIQQERLSSTADIILDGSLPPDDLLKQALGLLEESQP